MAFKMARLATTQLIKQRVEGKVRKHGHNGKHSLQKEEKGKPAREIMRTTSIGARDFGNVLDYLRKTRFLGEEAGAGREDDPMLGI